MNTHHSIHTQSLTVSFIGLGAMGWHMASHLNKVCSTVQVWNRSFKKAELHAQSFGTFAVDLQQAVQADIIFSCLPTSADVENLIENVELKSGAIWVDCTSGVPASAQKLAKYLEKFGVDYLDAPVSGQTIGAEKGCLTVMVAGKKSAFEQAKPVIQSFAGLIEYVGESGSGFAVKAVNNTLMAANLWAAAEGLSILKAHQVNLEAALNCINHSSGGSTMSETIISQRILTREFNKTFALDLLQKDIGIAMDLKNMVDLELNLLQDTQTQFNLIEKSQAKALDFSAAVQCLEQQSGIKLDT